MVRRQHQRTSSPSTSAQIRKPAVTTRSRRSQNTELVDINSIEKKFAFDMKRKRKSDIEAVTPEEKDGIDRQSLSYSNNTLVIQNSNISDSIKLEDNAVSSPSKRPKLSTGIEHNKYNNNQFDTDSNMQDVIQTNVERRGIKLENNSSQNGVEVHERDRDSAQRNSIYKEPLRNGVEIKNMVQSGIENGVNEITKDIVKNENKNNCNVIQDYINNIEVIIDNFKDVIEIRGTQMVIGKFVIEYSDYQKFLMLLNKLMDILEKSDSEKLLQSAERVGYKGNAGQVLNPKLFRAKISKRAYKSLNEFQDDFTCTCNDAIAANPEEHDIGMQFLKFGSRLFEQAYKELPSGIRQLCERDENLDAKNGASFPNQSVTKRLQKVALIQPTSDGHVFSSGTIKQSPLETDVFKLVGDLQDMAVVSSQSMDEQEIPTIGSILPKREDHEFPVSEERKVPGVKFHKYKAYASFAPTYDSSVAMLSYEDTILTRTHKKHIYASKDIDDSDLSEEEEDAKMVNSEEITQMESFGIASSSKQNNSEDDVLMENNSMNGKLFEDIDVDLLFKSTQSTQSIEENKIDKILDENVELFKKVQSMQEKRIKSNTNIISTKERELAINLQKKLANIISEVPPSELVSFDSLEDAMDNLLIKEKSFRGMLPPDKSFAHPTNEVSRDAFGSFSGVEKSSEDMEQAYTTEYSRSDTNAPMKSEETLSQVPHQVLTGPSSITPHSVPHPISQQSVSSQSLHHSIPHSLPLQIPASMTYSQPSRATASQVPMRMSYGVSQGMNTQMHASYQMTYSRSLSGSSHATPYYPSQRYPPSYGYSYYSPYNGYPMSHSTWHQRPSYY